MARKAQTGQRLERDGITRRAGKRGTTWSVRVKVLDSHTGKERVEVLGSFKTESEAKAVRDKARVDSRQGAFVSLSKITVEEYFEKWLSIKESSLERDTFENYASKLRSYLYPSLGSLPLQAVRPSHLQELYSKLAKEGGGLSTSRKAGLSENTISQFKTIVRGGFENAVKVDRLLIVNPVDLVSVPRGESKVEKDLWSAVELRAFLEELKEHRLYAFFYVAVFTGARRSEVCGLQWSDVDFKESTIRFRRSRTRTGVKQTTKSTKGERRQRTVTVTSDVLDVLKAFRAIQLEDMQKTGKWVNDGYVFTRESGEPIHVDTPSKLFEKVKNSLDLPEQHLHMLRHLHASFLLAANEPLHVVSKRLGHKDPSFTARQYAHVLPQQDAQAAQRFAEVLGK